MKTSLLLSRLSVAIFLLSFTLNSSGQTVIFSEDFSGFTTGSHTSPSTSDISGSLDSRTHQPGWSGYKVYSAGGEIKTGTSTVPGWIETPSIDFSGHSSQLFLKFDISRWPDDECTVKILLNGDQIGDIISPEDEFKTIIMAIGQGITSGKIRFESQAKRYFLDNVIIEAGEVTAVQHIKTDHHLQISVFPNPSADIITVNNIGSFSRLDIISISGEICKVVVLSGEDKIEITTEGLRPGVYFVKVSGIAGSVTKKFIKYR
ncbi:MAG TPA: T9SS type A sorting domain-containing protein [Bacteroidales bacterium]|nr:T9SS type A sorting domain-containing protein [Bacteroidales bacterium]